jgi:hypothetical protein
MSGATIFWDMTPCMLLNGCRHKREQKYPVNDETGMRYKEINVISNTNMAEEKEEHNRHRKEGRIRNKIESFNLETLLQKGQEINKGRKIGIGAHVRSIKHAICHTPPPYKNQNDIKCMD